VMTEKYKPGTGIPFDTRIIYDPQLHRQEVD